MSTGDMSRKPVVIEPELPLHPAPQAPLRPYISARAGVQKKKPR